VEPSLNGYHGVVVSHLIAANECFSVQQNSFVLSPPCHESFFPAIDVFASLYANVCIFSDPVSLFSTFK
jgi:hypothetical protein